MKKVAFLGLFTTFALILSYVESLIPIFVPIPGFKLGLANFAILLALYLFGVKEAALVNAVRIILAAVLFGNMYSLIYSLAGAILSLLIMALLKKVKSFSIVGVSVSGAIAHNIGQFLVAILIIKTYGLLFYFPFLVAFGVATGIINGLLVSLIFKRLRPILNKDKG
jgi:heptaprenyl diphosphate synthase